MTHHTSGRTRLHRSELAVPATSERFFQKAADSAADVIFLDLEDAVAPRLKNQARKLAIDALNQVDWGNKTMAVRVNDLETAWALDDIVDVVTHAPRLDMILLPKAGSGFDIRFVDQLLTLLERGSESGKHIGLEALIETARGVAYVEEIAAASPRLEALIFGVGDYTVSMQTFDRVYGRPSERYAILTHGQEASAPRELHWNDQWHFAMARMANACRANGLRPIDGPFTDFADEAGYRASARRAAALGFEGKWAIHPVQIDLANEVFSPSAHDLAWAEDVQRLMTQAQERGDGAANADGVLVDMAHLKQAQAILERQEMIRQAQG